MTASWWRIARRMTMQLSTTDTTGSWQRSKNTGPLSYCQLPGNHAPATNAGHTPGRFICTLFGRDNSPPVVVLTRIVSCPSCIKLHQGANQRSLEPVTIAAIVVMPTPPHIYVLILIFTLLASNVVDANQVVMTSLNVPLRTDLSF